MAVRLFEEAESVQLAALGNLVQVGCFGHGRGADCTELVVQVKTSGDRETDPAADAGVDADILLAADLVGDRVADDA
jgi:hypothetical protein